MRQTPSLVWGFVALHHVRNVGHVAEPTPGTAISSSIMWIVFTLVCSRGVAFYKAQQQNILEGLSYLSDTVPLPSLGV